MDAQEQKGNVDTEKDRTRRCDAHSHHIIQTGSTVETPGITQQPDPLSERFPCSSGTGHRGSDESLADIVITSEDALLLPDHVPVIPHKFDKEPPSSLNGASHSDVVTNRTSPVCTPPTASSSQRAPEPAPVPKCNGHDKPHKKRPPSTSKSQQSLKTSANQIQQDAGNDCCVHCVLACLFCEALSLCSALAQCLACGMECDALCCCGEACGGLACCSEDPCSAILDCAILEDCCQSSDCLEICLECCSICFPA